MSRVNPGLQEGNLETSVVQAIELNFNIINADFSVGDKVFKLLQELCVMSDFSSADQKVHANLSQDERDNYNFINVYFFNPIREFPNLEIMATDLSEVHYTMQNKLFKCLCKKIEDAGAKSDYDDWMQKTNKTLTNKHSRLPILHRTPVDHRQRFMGRWHALVASLFFLVGLYMVFSNLRQDDAVKSAANSVDMVLFRAVLCFLAATIAIYYRAIPAFRNAGGQRYTRKIFATPPTVVENAQKEEEFSEMHIG